MTTSISKHEDVEVGHWYRLPGDIYSAGTTQEVVGLEWSQAANGVIVHLRNEGDDHVHMTPFAGWRTRVRPTLPPWAE